METGLDFQNSSSGQNSPQGAVILNLASCLPMAMVAVIIELIEVIEAEYPQLWRLTCSEKLH
ncbi:MAG: hypothetical protein CVV64_02390 [Candidatus Wallbacteria bacterium HGW-Wallbacteria-1]|jgi:uncharacterized Fe-S radical SAM superfamily protein PflX|uniref:Uncharacterized protein n=1 Tax=Candidatus Wallbacteria bacterium HGW-Wallbacteria-1 TaxID=2013854 RepID=A0A2N1PVC4_9BACT|nr:MAG: hypothetical protein CVV64_02390 [Candidatus Wallbacteria bacterium HGW-Wallbacteria-1]